MKHQLLYLLALGLTCGCTHDAEPSPADLVPPEGTPLEIAGVQMGGYAETRATYTPFPPAGTASSNYSIGLYCQKADPSDKEQYNYQYIYDSSDSKWYSIDAGVLLMLHGTDTDVYAYHPYKDETTDATIRTKTSPDFGNSYSMGTMVNNHEFDLKTCYYHPDFDICYGVSKKRNGTPSGKVATFKLDHIMAKFQLTLVRHKDYPGVCQIKRIYLRHRQATDPPTKNNFITEARFDMLTGTWNPPSTMTVYDYPPDPTVSLSNYAIGPITITKDKEWNGYDTMTSEQKVETRPILLIPEKIGPPNNSGSTLLTVEIEVDGRKMQTVLNIGAYGGLICSGQFYKATLIIHGTDIKVNSVEVANWEEQTIQNSGKDFEPKPAE